MSSTKLAFWQRNKHGILQYLLKRGRTTRANDVESSHFNMEPQLVIFAGPDPMGAVALKSFGNSCPQKSLNQVCESMGPKP